MPWLGASPPDPPNQGIQSYVLFRDLEIRRSEILRANAMFFKSEIFNLTNPLFQSFFLCCFKIGLQTLFLSSLSLSLQSLSFLLIARFSLSSLSLPFCLPLPSPLSSSYFPSFPTHCVKNGQKRLPGCSPICSMSNKKSFRKEFLWHHSTAIL